MRAQHVLSYHLSIGTMFSARFRRILLTDIMFRSGGRIEEKHLYWMSHKLCPTKYVTHCMSHSVLLNEFEISNYLELN